MDLSSNEHENRAPEIEHKSAIAPEVWFDKKFTLTIPLINIMYDFIDPVTGKVHFSYVYLKSGLSLFFLLGAGIVLLKCQDFSQLCFFNQLVAVLYTIGLILCLCILNGWVTTERVISFDKEYLVSQVCLSFAGLKLYPFSFFDCKYNWPDLKCVRYVKENEGGLSSDGRKLRRSGSSSERIVLDWKTHKSNLFAYRQNTTYINRLFLSTEAQEKLFSALALRVPQELLTPEILYLQVQTLSGRLDSPSTSFTQVWFDEFNRNFELSNNITLAPGAKCGNGRFVILTAVAIRFNSATYLASDATGCKVIVKELVVPVDAGESVQQKLLEQFNREAAILAKVEHPSIVQVIDHFIENSRSYIVMALAEGTNLRECLRINGTFSEDDVVRIGLQLASVLCYLHQHNPAIIHRDFTPDNMVYASNGTVKVIDFGAANLYNTNKTATLIGKQNYMPPEQIQGKPSPASDIYAFGATLCFLLTGQDLPSMGKLPNFDKAVISNELLAIIESCTSFEAGQRPNSYELVRLLKKLDNANV